MDTKSETLFTPQNPEPTDFTNVPLDGEKKKKQPRRLIHFSDGVLEEYSTDEEETPPPQPVVDPKSLTWGPWTWHYATRAAVNTLSAADFCGEKLAWFFGITTPKYQSAIDEFYRYKREEEEDAEREARVREKLEGLSSIDVKIVDDKPGYEESGIKPVEKY